MLLTLTASCLKPLIQTSGARGRRSKGDGTLDLADLPVYTRETLGLTGLNLSTDLLVGADRARLEGLRERADKASCACLLLIESEPQPFGAESEKKGTSATERTRRVVEAAQILGCTAAAVTVESTDDSVSLTRVATRLKPVVERAEKLDVSLLISPSKGLTSTPERLAELIKKVGGFRIGTFPDFQTASGQKDPTAYLRRLTPYASVVSASTTKFKVTPGKDGEPDEAVHEGYDLRILIKAVASVGYDGTLAVDYRGAGDLTMGVIYSRNALQEALDEMTAAA